MILSGVTFRVGHRLVQHAGQGEELGPAGRVGPQRAQQGRRDGLRAVRSDAAQRHAGVLGFKHHAHARGAKTGGQALGDLLGQPLLDLRPGGEVLDQTGQLGQPDDALARQVADVGEAGERQQVMLADGAERDGPASTSSS